DDLVHRHKPVPAAHEGALGASGKTIAVLGCGTDVCYPPEHAGLQRRIAQDGCVVSELPPGTPPRAWHFPSRNRILAGITSGVVVVQAEPRSGALITAKQALQENREVMAVPGDVQDPRSRGPHALLRQGAALVTSAADVFDALGWLHLGGAPGRSDPGQFEHGELLEQLRAPMGPDELCRRLGWPAGRLQRALVELELAGIVERDPAGRVRRADPSSSC
ncbi:MAG: DNA-processing protein DprA, partial [Candidatus Krumholzibacteriia bacterium]